MSAPAHHRPDGFQNNDGDFEAKTLADVIRWRWNAARRGLPPRPQAPIPTQAPDLGFLHANVGAAQQPAVTWIGHATVLAQLGGLNLLTDPIFPNGPRPCRLQAPGVNSPRVWPCGICRSSMPS